MSDSEARMEQRRKEREERKKQRELEAKKDEEEFERRRLERQQKREQRQKEAEDEAEGGATTPTGRAENSVTGEKSATNTDLSTPPSSPAGEASTEPEDENVEILKEESTADQEEEARLQAEEEEAKRLEEEERLEKEQEERLREEERADEERLEREEEEKIRAEEEKLREEEEKLAQEEKEEAEAEARLREEERREEEEEEKLRAEERKEEDEAEARLREEERIEEERIEKERQEEEEEERKAEKRLREEERKEEEKIEKEKKEKAEEENSEKSVAKRKIIEDMKRDRLEQISVEKKALKTQIGDLAQQERELANSRNKLNTQLRALEAEELKISQPSGGRQTTPTVVQQPKLSRGVPSSTAAVDGLEDHKRRQAKVEAEREAERLQREQVLKSHLKSVTPFTPERAPHDAGVPEHITRQEKVEAEREAQRQQTEKERRANLKSVKTPERPASINEDNKGIDEWKNLLQNKKRNSPGAVEKIEQREAKKTDSPEALLELKALASARTSSAASKVADRGYLSGALPEDRLLSPGEKNDSVNELKKISDSRKRDSLSKIEKIESYRSEGGIAPKSEEVPEWQQLAEQRTKSAANKVADQGYLNSAAPQERMEKAKNENISETQVQLKKKAKDSRTASLSKIESIEEMRKEREQNFAGEKSRLETENMTEFQKLAEKRANQSKGKVSEIEKQRIARSSDPRSLQPVSKEEIKNTAEWQKMVLKKKESSSSAIVNLEKDREQKKEAIEALSEEQSVLREVATKKLQSGGVGELERELQEKATTPTGVTVLVDDEEYVVV